MDEGLQSYRRMARHCRLLPSKHEIDGLAWCGLAVLCRFWGPGSFQLAAMEATEVTEVRTFDKAHELPKDLWLSREQLMLERFLELTIHDWRLHSRYLRFQCVCLCDYHH